MTIAVILVRQIHLVVIDTNDWSSADDGITIISHENVNVPSINFLQYHSINFLHSMLLDVESFNYLHFIT